MSENDQERSLPTALIVATALLCLFVAFCVFIYVSGSRRYGGTRPELIGDWYGESNNKIQFSVDGTGLGYIGGQPPQFFRWSESKGTLRIIFEPRQKSLAIMAHQILAKLRGTPAFNVDSYRIESLTTDAMTLSDPSTGRMLQFRTIGSIQ
jgi:hypothetical protein